MFTEIHGADVDPTVLFTEIHISTHVVDQLSEGSLNELARILGSRCPRGFSVIVDDGLHVPAANIASFHRLFDLVMPGGFYVIEDVLPRYLTDVLNGTVMKRACNWGLWSNPIRSADNQLVVIQKRDPREDG